MKLVDSVIRIGFVWHRRYGGEQRNKTLYKGRVSQHRVAQRGIRQPRQHRELTLTHEFARLSAKGREAENAVAVRMDRHKFTFSEIVQASHVESNGTDATR